MPKITWLLGLIMFVSVRIPMVAQEQEREPRFEDRVEVTEVLLDVLVTDRKGEPVLGLGIDDFEVVENGTPVEVTGVEYYGTRYGLEGDAESGVEDVPASRYFIFFFHDQRRISNPRMNLVQQQLSAARESKRWLEESVQPSDWFAVAGYDVKLKIFEDFTQDLDALQRAIDAAAIGEDPERTRAGWIDDRPAGLPSLLANLPSGVELREKTENIYHGMRLLAEATGHIVGRKNLLLYSIGFGELERFGAFVRPDSRYYPDLEESLNQNNIAVYPLDLTRVGTEHAQSNFLSTIAADTGGVYIRNFVNFVVPLREIGKENVGYYLLSYRSEHPAGATGYQKVKVRARSSGLKIRAREGYRYGS